VQESGFFAADKCTGAFFDLEVQIKAAAEDVLSEQAIGFRVGDGLFQPLDGEGILCTAVDVAFAGSDGIGADDHAFDDTVRIALHHGTVHESARIALVGVADDIFLFSGLIEGEFPFFPGRKTAAATAAQTRFEDLLDHLGWGHFTDSAGEAPVATAGKILIDALGINDTAVLEHQLFLFGEKGHLTKEGQLFPAGLAVGRFIDAEQFLLNHLVLNQGFLQEQGDIFRFDLAVTESGTARDFNVDDHLFGAVANASGRHDLDLEVQPLQFTQDRRMHPVGAVGETAGPHADEDDRFLVVLQQDFGFKGVKLFLAFCGLVALLSFVDAIYVMDARFFSGVPAVGKYLRI